MQEIQPAVMAQSLLRRWLAWLLAATLLTVIVGHVAALHHERTVTAPALSQTTGEIAGALGAELNRALGLGIPLPALRGMPDWLSGVVSANPLVVAVAVTDGAGNFVFRHGTPEGLAVALAHARGSTARSGPGARWVVARQGLQATPGGGEAGGLLVVAETAVVPWSAMLLAGLATLVPLLAAAVWLRHGLVHSLVQPLAQIDDAARAIAAHELPALSRSGRGADSALAARHLLAKRVQSLRDRLSALAAKLAEVRAAHFDPSVLERLDALGRGLATWRLGDAAVPHAAASGGSRVVRGVVAIGSWTLPAQLTAGAAAGMLAVACGAAGLYVLHQRNAQQQLLGTGEQLLQLAWDATLEADRARLGAALGEYRAVPGLFAALQRPAGPAAEGDETAAPEWPRVDGTVLTVLDGAGLPLGSTAARPSRPYPSAAVVALLRQDAGNAGQAGGIWQGQDRSYQSGVVLLERGAGGSSPRMLVVSRPLVATLAQLSGRLGAPVALADLRGQAVGDDAAGLTTSWREQGRRSHQAVLTGGQSRVLAVPLVSTSGHTIGTLLAAQPAAQAPGAGQTLGVWGLALVTLGAVAAALWHVRLRLRPVARVAAQLGSLASDLAVPEPAGATAAHHPLPALRLAPLRHAVAEVGARIDALRAMRRSRERQGRRQARFIRHQMLALAGRLDEAARAGVLDDLQRIESASRDGPVRAAVPAPADPRLDPIVDEVGVLALGFQNLVSRVGDQYQELDRLVQELREALRVKTQFIAIQQELEIARKMQLSILPRNFGDRPGLSIRASMTPAKEVGGDFYDFFELDAHRVAVAVGDVSGKGVPAAFFMAVSRTLLRAVSSFDAGPAACLRQLNDLLAADNDEMMFVTLFYAVIDTRDGSVTWGNGGHNPPYVLRASGAIEELPGHGNMALAVMEGMDYQEGRLSLAAGDALFLFSDGVTEAMSPSRELYGEPRLEALLATLRDVPVAEVPERVLAALRQFEGEGAQADDITSLIARYTGAVA